MADAVWYVMRLSIDTTQAHAPSIGIVLSDASIVRFASILKSCYNIRILMLKARNLSDETISTLCIALLDKPRLTLFNLNSLAANRRILALDELVKTKPALQLMTG